LFSIDKKGHSIHQLLRFDQKDAAVFPAGALKSGDGEKSSSDSPASRSGDRPMGKSLETPNRIAKISIRPP
jgi:hypothetical protein